MFLQSTFTTKGYCKDCKSTQKIERKGINHLLHIALTLITQGFYAFFYLCYAIGWHSALKNKSEFWSCTNCGGKNVINDDDKDADRSQIPEIAK